MKRSDMTLEKATEQVTAEIASSHSDLDAFVRKMVGIGVQLTILEKWSTDIMDEVCRQLIREVQPKVAKVMTSMDGLAVLKEIDSDLDYLDMDWFVWGEHCPDDDPLEEDGEEPEEDEGVKPDAHVCTVAVNRKGGNGRLVASGTWFNVPFTKQGLADLMTREIGEIGEISPSIESAAQMLLACSEATLYTPGGGRVSFEIADIHAKDGE